MTYIRKIFIICCKTDIYKKEKRLNLETKEIAK